MMLPGFQSKVSVRLRRPGHLQSRASVRLRRPGYLQSRASERLRRPGYLQSRASERLRRPGYLQSRASVRLRRPGYLQSRASERLRRPGYFLLARKVTKNASEPAHGRVLTKFLDRGVQVPRRRASLRVERFHRALSRRSSGYTPPVCKKAATTRVESAMPHRYAVERFNPERGSPTRNLNSAGRQGRAYPPKGGALNVFSWLLLCTSTAPQERRERRSRPRRGGGQDARSKEVTRSPKASGSLALKVTRAAQPLGSSASKARDERAL